MARFADASLDRRPRGDGSHGLRSRPSPTYSAFDIVVALAGEIAWVAFLLAGTVAMCAGYSYVKFNEYTDDRGGAPTFIEELVGNSTLAGMTGWTLPFGYIGSIALYAYAFASFFTELLGRLHVAGLPLPDVASVLLIAAFVGLNLLGPPRRGRPRTC